MINQSFSIDFVSPTRSIEEALGIDIPAAATISLFDGSFAQPRTRIGNGGAADLVDGYYQFGFGVGLDLVIDRATFGTFKVDYPVKSEIVLPGYVTAGENFEVLTEAFVDVDGAQISGESISLGSVGMDLSVSSTGARIEELTFLNVFGEPAVDPALGPIVFDPFSETVRLVEFDLSVGASAEIIDGVEVSISSPGGEEDSSDPLSQNGVTTLPSIILEIDEALANISANPIELLDFIPALRPLDVLTEDFGPYGFSFLDRNYSLTAEYKLLAPFISAGFGIVQVFEFIPEAISVKIEIGKETFEGLLGESFDFTAPDRIAGELKGTITYDIDGAIAVSYRLAPIGSVGVDMLAAEFTLEEGGVETSLEFGPLLEASASGSTDIASLEIFRSDPIALPDEFFAPITKEFAIPTNRGQDIAFVIDTTGSMFDDIAAVRSQSASIIESIFDPARGLLGSRVAVVGYNDPFTETFLSFTDQPNPEDRKNAAISAINSISVGGGGDFPEAVNAGLLRALDGRAGEWREDAVARRIILFGDAPPNDDELRPAVLSLAADLNVALGADLPLALSAPIETTLLTEGLYLSTLALPALSDAGAPVALPVQIFTVQIGNDPTTLEDFESLASATGGAAFNAADASEVVAVLLEVLATPVNTPPSGAALSNDRVAENAAAGTIVGELAAIDPDLGDAHTFELLDNAGGRFALSGDLLVVADGSKLDFEAAGSHAILVRVTDSFGDSFDQPLTVQLDDVDDASPPPPAPTGDLDIYRFYNVLTKTHFYTASAEERDFVKRSFPQFQDEENRFDASSDPAAGVSIFRFYNTQTQAHFYTASAEERDFVQRTFPQFQFEGVAYHAWADDGGGAYDALYRFYNVETQVHFYTNSAEEKAFVEASFPQFKYENVAYYVDDPI